MDDQRDDRAGGGVRFRKLRIAWSVGVLFGYVILVFIAAAEEWISPRAIYALFCPLMIYAFGIAAMPWIRWRFSLRVLLVATTVVTVVLGIMAWAARK